MDVRKTKLTYIIHNPNTPEEMEDFLAEWYADAIYKRRQERLRAERQMKVSESKEQSTPA